MSQPRFPHPETFAFDDKCFSASEVVVQLETFIKKSRRKRMREVIAERSYTVTPVLEGIYDRGNVHAVLRSAEALGFQSVHIIDTSPRIKESSRVSQGAEKWLDLSVWESTREGVAAVRDRGYRILVTHPDDADPIDSFDFTEPTALVFGNEREGASDEMLAAADARVRIPMRGFTQSFNISVAAALCLYHIHQDREARLGAHGDLSPEEQTRLLAAYYLRSVGSAEKILCHE